MPLTDEDEARLSELAEEADAIADKGELTEEEDARHDEITAEIDRIENRRIYSDDTKQAGTVLVYLGLDGLRVFAGLPRDTHAVPPVDGLDLNGDAGETVAIPAKPREAEASALSAALTVELQAHRTAGLRAQVAERPGLALRLTVQSLLLARGHAGYRAVAKIRAEGPNLKPACPTIEDTPAHRALAEAIERIGDHQPGEHDRILSWLLGLDDGEVLSILAPLVAETVDAGTEDWSAATAHSYAAEVAQAADLDMRAYWTATPETFFGRVTKPQIGAAVRDAGAGPFSIDGKKADVALAATRLVAGFGWLPSMLRMPPPASETPSEAETEDREASMVLPQAAE